MSLQTWKDEFYPVDASEVSQEEAVAHSLRKWIGLRKENIAKHGVGGELPFSVLDVAGASLPIDANSCSLCLHYSDSGCPTCPITRAQGHPCDVAGGIGGSQWRKWRDDDNPEPMIAVLEKAQEWERAEQAKQSEAQS